jgi:hypothetical protein
MVLFSTKFASAYWTYPCELMKVALVVRVNDRRGSRTPVVKSRDSVEPSPFAGIRSLVVLLVRLGIPVNATKFVVVAGGVNGLLYVMGGSW